VIAGAVIIKVTDWLWVDSVIAVGIGLWVLSRTWVLLKESMNILLEGVPDGIDVEAVVRAIKAVPGVQDVHEMHIWALSSNKTSLSVHVVTSAETSAIRQIEVIRSMLADRFDIRHSTIQCELTPCGEATDAAHWIEPRTNLSKRASSASTN
jgi:cobalt-zinc-cadmium efflux system protein